MDPADKRAILLFVIAMTLILTFHHYSRKVEEETPTISDSNWKEFIAVQNAIEKRKDSTKSNSKVVNMK